MQTSQKNPSEEDDSLNYFVCTLGQAAAINHGTPSPFKTVNEFIDDKSRSIADRPAVAFPLPRKGHDSDLEWHYRIYCNLSF